MKKTEMATKKKKPIISEIQKKTDLGVQTA